MVMLTICAPSNPHTVYFDQPLQKPSHMRLIHCALYNSWFNLKKRGEITWFTTGPDKVGTVLTIPPGHYNISKIAAWVEHVFRNQEAKLSVATYEVNGGLVFHKSTPHEIKLDHDLSELLGIGQKLLTPKTYVKRLTSPDAYYIHCDLIDKEQNLLNGKPSSLLSRLHIYLNNTFTKISYFETTPHFFCPTASDEFVNSLTISVMDSHGALFDFNGLPLEFVIEIN